MITFEPSDDIKKSFKKEQETEEKEIEVGVAESGTPVTDIVDAADEAAKEAAKEPVKETEEQTSKEEKIKETIENSFSMDENTTLFHKGNLRNGMSLEYEGSIVLLGDVNPGAQIKALGNILVLGSIKGTVHAGCGGSRDAFVFALNMLPVQLRIGDIITRFPDNIPKTNLHPEYAYVEDGKIYVAEF